MSLSMARRRSPVGLVSLLLLGAATAALTASGLPDPREAGLQFVPESLLRNAVRPPEGASAPSRFGVLTSSRWAWGGAGYQREVLTPVPNPSDELEPQPLRQHPLAVELNAAGTKVYVALSGNELDPESRVAIFDIAEGRVTGHIPLALPTAAEAPARGPWAMRRHPDGRHLVVTSRFANFAVVIDTETDRVVRELPLDFYMQGMALTPDGARAYVANRYLDQVFVVDFAEESAAGGEMRVRGGLDEAAFFQEEGGIHELLRRRCGACHDDTWPGGFYAGPDARQAFASVLAHAVPGDPAESRVLRTPLAAAQGGWADVLPKFMSHADQTVVFADSDDPDYRRLRDWIASTTVGPGIPVGNPRSKPDALALGTDGRYLYVGNTGTQDVSVVDTRTGREVGAIYLQNTVNDLGVYHSPATGRDYLIVATMGIGYGVVRERDPYGGESWDRDNRAAQYSAWRDCETGKMRPRAEQQVLGPLDAADGTSEIKFRDLQNDLLFVDLGALDVPEDPAPDELDYLLVANRYQAHRGWVRYTSDTAESTAGDIKGDIPPDLMRVVGALPSALTVRGDRLYVVMSGSNLVQEWRIDPTAEEASDYLTPLRTFSTGLNPMRIAAGPAGTPAAGQLFVSNYLGGTLTVIDTASGESREHVVDPSVLRRPVPDSNAERGEIMVRLSLFSSDGDTSCVHCHARDMGDGRPWGVSQVVGQEFVHADDEVGHFIIGGTMSPPQMRNLFEIQPFFFEGVISAFEPRSMIMEHTPSDDFARVAPTGDYTHLYAHYVMDGVDDIQANMDSGTEFKSDLEERREEMFKELTMRYFGKAVTLRDFVRFIGEWQLHEPRLLPNPFDQRHPAVLRGKVLFEDPQVGCVSCHPPPSFAKKDFPRLVNREQSFMSQVMFTPRDGAFTLIGMNRLDYLNGYLRDLDPWDIGRCEEQEGHFTSFPLRGVWDRPPAFLHSGIARTLREVIATPGHRALRRFKYEPLIGGNPERPNRREVGFNLTYYVPQKQRFTRMHELSMARIGYDTHGGTLHLRGLQLDDLVSFVNAIE